MRKEGERRRGRGPRRGCIFVFLPCIPLPTPPSFGERLGGAPLWQRDTAWLYGRSLVEDAIFKLSLHVKEQRLSWPIRVLYSWVNIVDHTLANHWSGFFLQCKNSN